MLEIGNAQIKFSIFELPENYVGCLPEDIELENDESLFGIIRDNRGFILYHNQPIAFESCDKLVFAKRN